MWKFWKKNRGQSIVEYLVVASLIIAAILAIRANLSSSANALYGTAHNVLGTSDDASVTNVGNVGLSLISATTPQ